MTTYLINHLRIPGGIPTEDELAYLEQVEAAVAPYDGKWLAIDAQVQVVEGAWPGSVVLMEFPDMAKAKEWYDSAGYQKIPPRRTTHSISDLVLVDGVGRASRPPASPSGSGRPSREPPGTAVTGPRLSRRALEEAQEGNRCFADRWARGSCPGLAKPSCSTSGRSVLLPEPEREWARATLAHHNQVGDPSV